MNSFSHLNGAFDMWSFLLFIYCFTIPSPFPVHSITQMLSKWKMTIGYVDREVSAEFSINLHLVCWRFFSSNFFSSGAIIVFRFYALFPPFAFVQEQGRTSSSTSPSYSIICYPSNFRYKKYLVPLLFRDKYVDKQLLVLEKPWKTHYLALLSTDCFVSGDDLVENLKKMLKGRNRIRNH